MTEANERQIEQALRMIVTAAVDEPALAERARARLTRWRARSAERESAYREAERRWQAMGMAAPELRETFPEPQPTAPAAPRTALGIGFIIVMVGVLFGLDRWRTAQPLLQHNYVTATAQVLSVPLPDGSRIELDAQTRLAVVLYRDRREARLTEGAARFDVAADATRPFRVQTRQANVEVVGTVFTVTDRGQLSVAVEQGHVRVSNAAGTSSIDLQGGDAARLDEHAQLERYALQADDSAPWRDGWLQFDDVPLAEALPHINAWLQRPLQIDSPEIARMRLTGRLRGYDESALIAALPAILPVEVVTLSDGSLQLSPRKH